METRANVETDRHTHCPIHNCHVKDCVLEHRATGYQRVETPTQIATSQDYVPCQRCGGTGQIALPPCECSYPEIDGRTGKPRARYYNTAGQPIHVCGR